MPVRTDMPVSLIWAQARNGVIGADQGIPWHLPEDLANFRRLTRGATVIMGRATWDSLPAAVRPLPGRTNIVLTRSPSREFPGAQMAPSLGAALAIAEGPCFIIGGGNLYRQAVSVATHAFVTVVDIAAQGDTFAPALPGWELQRGPWMESGAGLRYRYDVLTAGPQSGGYRPATASLTAAASLA